MNELYKAIDEALIHETKHVSSWDESRRDQTKNVIVNRERVIPAILDAVIAALPKQQEPYRTGVDPDSMFRKGQSFGFNSALIDVTNILQSAKENKQ